MRAALLSLTLFLAACDPLAAPACTRAAEMACELCSQDEYSEAICTCVTEGTLTAAGAPEGLFESDTEAEEACFVWQTQLHYAGPDEQAVCKENVDILKELDDDGCEALGYAGGGGGTIPTFPTGGTDPTDPTGGTNPGPGGGDAEILGWSGECRDNNTFVGTLTTTGDVSEVAVLNIWETGAPDVSAWNEEQELVDGKVVLTQVGSPADVGPSGSGKGGTLFGCGPGEHFDQDETTLTYAVRIYDADGNFADCIQFGHEPRTVSDSDYTTAGGAPSNAAELRNCRTLN